MTERGAPSGTAKKATDLQRDIYVRCNELTSWYQHDFCGNVNFQGDAVRRSTVPFSPDLKGYVTQDVWDKVQKVLLALRLGYQTHKAREVSSCDDKGEESKVQENQRKFKLQAQREKNYEEQLAYQNHVYRLSHDMRLRLFLRNDKEVIVQALLASDHTSNQEMYKHPGILYTWEYQMKRAKLYQKLKSERHNEDCKMKDGYHPEECSCYEHLQITRRLDPAEQEAIRAQKQAENDAAEQKRKADNRERLLAKRKKEDEENETINTKVQNETDKRRDRDYKAKSEGKREEEEKQRKYATERFGERAMILEESDESKKLWVVLAIPRPPLLAEPPKGGAEQTATSGKPTFEKFNPLLPSEFKPSLKKWVVIGIPRPKKESQEPDDQD